MPLLTYNMSVLRGFAITPSVRAWAAYTALFPSADMLFIVAGHG